MIRSLIFNAKLSSLAQRNFLAESTGCVKHFRCTRMFSSKSHILDAGRDTTIDMEGPSNHSQNCNGPISKKWDYDILINGGGIVGITFAAQVLQKTSNKLKIGIIDIRPPATLASCNEIRQPDIRVYALSPTSISILKKIDAWKYIEARTQPYHDMQVWESSGPGVVRFAASELNEPELGRIVEDRTVQAAVYESIKEKGHEVDLLFGCAISGFMVRKTDFNSWGPAEVVTTSSSSSAAAKDGINKLTARLLVGADGANSQVRRLGGIGSWGWGYGQEAVVCTVQVAPRDTETRDNGTAWQRYLATGDPLALLPLWDDYSSVVWSTSVTESRRLCGLSDADFLTELNAALQAPSHVDRWSPLNLAYSQDSSTSNSTLQDDFPSFSPFAASLLKPIQEVARGLARPLKKIKTELSAIADTAMTAALMQNPFQSPPKVLKIESRRVTFPLQFQQAKSYSSARVALLGDAAHSIHPQAGQGLNLGLQDADALSAVVLEGLATGEDIGSPQMLKKYETRRYYNNLAMMSIVDSLNTIFSIGKTSHVHPPSSSSSTSSSPLRPPQLESITGIERAALFLRSAGMLGINSIGPFKGRIAKVAMGMQKKESQK